MERSGMRERSPGLPPAFAGVYPGYDWVPVEMPQGIV
jgi:hypothetical protein